ncbi:glutamate--tRNA ligase family protein [Mucilaginibacter sp. dw_454]|uniref:glutamate--tRNA ligase family protein n=1 Tax=Mucilaginibacter sp. dw_454 TaxID=2720079 RepID=UPI001BD33D02|nr:glutamate--tRNA ligase family protein [Mucilaginibacter sp. dw_454]
MLNNETKFTRTRIAPTPSGYLHLGNALSFALTAAIARKTGAKILLRIDDLDQQRVNHLYVQDIFDTLNFLEIPWDEGPRNVIEYHDEWSQLHRMDMYDDALQQLAEQRGVFACKCSRSQLQGDSYPGNCINKSLPLDTPETAWRLYTDDRPIDLKTLTDGITTIRLPETMKNFVVKKKDNFPAYQLASIVDDLHFGVDLVIRGEDLFPSTLAQLFLADVLGVTAFANTTFHHHPLLMEDDDKKLSKSAGSTSIKYLREQGRTAAEVYQNIVSMLGILTPVRSFKELEQLL